jgi:cell division transport system permease protein
MSKNIAYKISPSGTYFNYIATIFSMLIMLYLLGLIGLVVISTDSFLASSKESIIFYVELADETKQADVFSFQKKLEQAVYTKPQSVTYISNEEGLRGLQAEEILTKEEEKLLGENLLPNMISFVINEANFANYPKIISRIEREAFVTKVFYTDTPAQNLSTKVYRLEIILILLVIFFIFVAITLIKNTLKLLLIANKDQIQTLQTVGATFDYIARPYLKRGFRNGWLSSSLAVVALWLTYWGLSDWNILTNQKAMISISIALVTLGTFLYWIVTRQSIKKHLTTPISDWKI